MFSKVIKRLQFVTAVWSPKHLQLAELWSPFFSPGPESVYVCMQIKVMYKQIFYCSLWKKKKTKNKQGKKKGNKPTNKKKEKKWYISEARGQSIPEHLFQNSSASAAASWLPTVATPALLSHRAGGVWWVISRGLFPEVKSLSMSSRKVAEGWREAADPRGRAKTRSSGRPSPFLLEPSQIQHVDTPSPHLFFSLPREGGI